MKRTCGFILLGVSALSVILAVVTNAIATAPARASDSVNFGGVAVAALAFVAACTGIAGLLLIRRDGSEG